MDKLKFAALLSYLSAQTGHTFDPYAIEQIANMTTPVNPVASWNNETVNQVLADVASGRKIEAIKLYRTVTGQGLKESKDAIEGNASGVRKYSY